MLVYTFNTDGSSLAHAVIAVQLGKSPVGTFRSLVIVRSIKDYCAGSSVPANIVTAFVCMGSKTFRRFSITVSTDSTFGATGAIPTANAATGFF